MECALFILRRGGGDTFFKSIATGVKGPGEAGTEPRAAACLDSAALFLHSEHGRVKVRR